MLQQILCNKFYEDHIEIEINFIPKDNFNKAKIYFDLAVYYSIDNTIIKYKGKHFYNEQELKHFLKTQKFTSKISPK